MSIDTYQADVARQAVQAGASMVNDVSGGRLDPDMHAQVRKLGHRLADTCCMAAGSLATMSPFMQSHSCVRWALGDAIRCLKPGMRLPQPAHSTKHGGWVQVAELGVPYIAMHMRGDPATMQQPRNLAYRDVCTDVGHELEASCEAACAAGIAPWRLILDPGAYDCRW